MDGANQDGVSKPVRTMDDIARLFMSGARDAASARRSPPGEETGGGGEANKPITTSMPVASAAEPAVEKLAADEEAHPPQLPTVQLAVSPLAGEAAWAALENAAQHIAAEQGVGVALVGVNEGVMRLMRAGPARNGVLAVARKSRADGTIDLQIARALFGLRENVELWLVALPFGPAMDHMLAAVRDWLLVCGTDNESIVSGYRAIKNLVAGDPVEEPRMLRVFPASDDYALAAVVHARLRRAAGEFLKQDLTLAGVTTKTPAAIETVAEFPVAHSAPAAWASVGEFLHDLIGAELTDEEPAEAESPEAEPPIAQIQLQLDEPREDPAVASGEAIVADEAVQAETPAPTDVSISGNVTLRIPVRCVDTPAAPNPVPPESPAPTAPVSFAAPTTRVIETTALTLDAQWNVVLASAAEISGGEVLEARPPREPHGAVIVIAAASCTSGPWPAMQPTGRPCGPGHASIGKFSP